MALISVIMPLYNKECSVARAIDSVLAQSWQDFEIVIVDDGSTDAGPELVQSYADPRIRLVRQENAGPGAARNAGIRIASSDYIAFIDADDEYFPDFLRTSIMNLEANPDCVLSVANHLRGPDRIIATSIEPFDIGIASGPWRMDPGIEAHAMWGSLVFIQSWVVLCRREIFTRFGGFYERHCTFAEDQFLWLQVILNCQIYRDTTPLFWYHIEDSDLGFLRTRSSAVPVFPFLTDPVPIRSNCPPEYRPALERMFEYAAALNFTYMVSDQSIVSFWRAYLRGIPETHGIPLDYPRQKEPGDPAASVYFKLRESLSARIRSICEANAITPDLFFLACLAFLACTYSSQETVVIGTPYADKEQEELQGLFGCFIQTIPVRIDTEKTSIVSSFLAYIKSQYQAAWEHTAISTDELIDSIGITRCSGINPICQIAFSFGTSDHRRMALGKNDLSLFMWQAGCFEGALTYSTQIFNADGMEAFAANLERVAKAFVADPGARLEQLELMDAQGRQLVDRTNRTEAPGYPGKTFLELFAASVTTFHDEPAVTMDEYELSYGDLDRLSDSLARRLSAAGVQPGERVGVYLNRDRWLVPSLLAVFKSGCAYVPLDPEFPPARLSGIAVEAGLRFVITVAALEAGVAELGPGISAFNADDSGGSAPDAELPVVGPEQTAYVLFTSGSTGAPKGVPICHGALANLLQALGSEPGMTRADTVVAITTLAFDASILEIFLPLASGARIALLSAEAARDADAIVARIKRDQANYIVATPSRWSLILGTGWTGRPGMTFIVGGEAFPRTLADAMLSMGATVWNSYGPTETTVCTSQYRVVPEAVPPCIGKPIANTAFFVLDSGGRPLPAGFPGELAIAGAGLSAGYLGRPDLTAERFVEIGHGNRRFRVYRTGDLVQQLSSGDFRYLGRNDFQVKIRGFRIELEEIESALRLVPGVREAACSVWRRSEQDARIVAYYTAEPGADMTLLESQLKSRLKHSLPEYMIPGHFMVLDGIPRTPGGKTDRKALPLPADTGETQGGKAPATQLQEQMLAVWSEVLGHEVRGIDESFFDLGGHSLLVVSLIRKLNARLGSNMRPRDLFDNPTIEGLADLCGNLAARPEQESAIRPRADRSHAPLSSQQERLWFVHELDPDKPLFNIINLIKITGPCDTTRLKNALEAFFDRHDLFRACIQTAGGRPAMSFADRAAIPVEELDLTRFEPDAAREALEGHLRNLVQTPLVFSRYPLCTATIARISGNISYACLLVPHIFADGWSSDIFVNELKQLYWHSGDASWSLPVLKADFGDYAAWERGQRETRQVPEQITAFWKEYLKDIPEVHDLPLDFPRPRASSGLGSATSFTLDGPLSAEVRSLCESHAITPSMFFLGCLAFLIRNYANQRTVVIGTPYANRELEQVQGLFGYFIRTIPLRLDIDEAASVDGWLGYVKEQFLAAWEHASVELDELVELLGVPRSTNVNPVYQIVFAFQKYGTKPCTTPSGENTLFTAVPFERGISENDLALNMWEANLFRGSFAYSTDLFDKASMEAFATNFVRVVRAFARGSGSRLGQIQLMDSRGRELVDLTNRTAKPGYMGRTFLDLFKATVKSCYNRPAVTSDGAMLTYGGLDQVSGSIGKMLVAAGLRPGERVGIYMNRDRWLVPALLAVFKAGGAYVPLDPQYPRDRLSGIMADAGLRFIVTVAALESQAALLGPGIRILKVESSEPAAKAELPDNKADQTAYVLFTSGSTGKPKGVPIRHDSLANLLLSMRDEPGMEQGDTVLALTTFTFDISALEFFLPLICGAKLVMADYDTSLDSQRLAFLIESENITFIQATPSRWALLLEAGLRSGVGRTFLTGGEALPPALARALLATGASVWNMYGPTETTVWSSIHQLTQDEQIPSIGKPIANTSFYVLDHNDRPLPAGIPGELAIGGAGLSEGYLNRPDLTEKRFIWIDDNDSRLRVYKTGDLVQQSQSGDFRYLGRNDFQVKIRGFRIEPGEIESVMQTFPGILEAVCTVWVRSEQDKRIVGYYRADKAIDELVLKAFLKKSLPDYMVPGHFMALDEFPKTSSSKKDRKALPLPGVSDEPAASRAPVSALQKQLLAVWNEVLCREVSGIDENFFDLGGHSLLVVSLVNKLNNRLGGKWNVRDLFDNPTVEGMAAVHGDAGTAITPEPVIIPRRLDRSRTRLSTQQERLWIIHEMDPDKPQYNLVFAVQIEGPCSTERLGIALKRFFSRHDLFRAFIKDEDGIPFISYVDEAYIPAEQLDFSNLDIRTARDAFQEHIRDLTRTPIALSRYPVARATIARFPGESCCACLLVPHIFADGWSSEIFYNELKEFYNHAGDESWAPASLRIDFGDYATWERERTETGYPAGPVVAFWKEYLKGIPEAHDLPLDHARPKESSGLGSSLRFSIDQGQAARIRIFCESHSITPNMFFLACLALLVRKHSGKETIVIGTPYANREHEDTRSLFGYFVRTIPLRFDVDCTWDEGRFLAYVKNQFLTAWEHSSIGFEELVSVLAVPRSLNINPVYQIIFAFQSYGSGHGEKRDTDGPLFMPATFDLGLSENDLAVYLGGTDRFEGAVAYSTDIFERQTIESIISNFLYVVRVMAEGFKGRLELINLNDAQGQKPIGRTNKALMSDGEKHIQGARMGKDPQGNPAWFLPDPERPGKYIRLEEKNEHCE